MHPGVPPHLQPRHRRHRLGLRYRLLHRALAHGSALPRPRLAGRPPPHGDGGPPRQGVVAAAVERAERLLEGDVAARAPEEAGARPRLPPARDGRPVQHRRGREVPEAQGRERAQEGPAVPEQGGHERGPAESGQRDCLEDGEAQEAAREGWRYGRRAEEEVLRRAEEVGARPPQAESEQRLGGHHRQRRRLSGPQDAQEGDRRDPARRVVPGAGAR
mmetsp:Transcript_14584/g.39029  ORF Transcript_14584/g.39029 Transcript_14584/m.39029 type:complete len:217 (-) Transcript_14584:383-1033(-)